MMIRFRSSFLESSNCHVVSREKVGIESNGIKTINLDDDHWSAFCIIHRKSDLCCLFLWVFAFDPWSLSTFNRGKMKHEQALVVTTVKEFEGTFGQVKLKAPTVTKTGFVPIWITKVPNNSLYVNHEHVERRWNRDGRKVHGCFEKKRINEKLNKGSAS